MKDLKVHPRLAMLSERFGGKAAAFVLSGFVAPSPDETVRLYPHPNSDTYIEIAQEAVLHFEQDQESYLTALFVDPAAIVSMGTIRKAPLMAMALRTDDRPDGGGGGGGSKTCVEKRIEKCKSDPDVHNKEFCDSDEFKSLAGSLCRIFGDPAEFVGGVIIV